MEGANVIWHSTKLAIQRLKLQWEEAGLLSRLEKSIVLIVCVILVLAVADVHIGSSKKLNWILHSMQVPLGLSAVSFLVWAGRLIRSHSEAASTKKAIRISKFLLPPFGLFSTVWACRIISELTLENPQYFWLAIGVMTLFTATMFGLAFCVNVLSLFGWIFVFQGFWKAHPRSPEDGERDVRQENMYSTVIRGFGAITVAFLLAWPFLDMGFEQGKRNIASTLLVESNY